MNHQGWKRISTVLFVLFTATAWSASTEEKKASFLDQFAPPELHGFYEVRAGYRTRKDPYEKDMSIMETRLQLDLSTYNDWADFKFVGDMYGDMITEQGDFDMRQGWLFRRLSNP